MIEIGINEGGFYRDRLDTILEKFQQKAYAIYGNDRKLGPETPDGQFLGAFAEGADDLGQAIEDTYNGRNPDVATGQNLTSTCRLNGVDRLIGEYSYVDVTVEVSAGATVPLGTKVQDEDTGDVYSFMADVVGDGSSKTVTCVSATKGASSAAGKVTKIVNPTYGLLSVANPSPSSATAPDETDEQLRIRRNLSTAAPTSGYLDSIQAGVLATPGVGKVKVWENDEGSYKSIKPGDSALPPHCVAVVVTAGSATAIGAAIYARKAPGVTSVGSTEVTVADSLGVAHTMRYTLANTVNYVLKVSYRERSGAGFGSAGGEAAIKEALLAWSLEKQLPTDDVYRGWVSAVAQGAVIGLDGRPAIIVENIQLGLSEGTLASTDLALAWNDNAVLLEENIILEKLP